MYRTSVAIGRQPQHKLSLRIEDENAIVAVAVGDDDLAVGRDGHGRRLAEVPRVRARGETLAQHQARLRFWLPGLFSSRELQRKRLLYYINACYGKKRNEARFPSGNLGGGEKGLRRRRVGQQWLRRARSKRRFNSDECREKRGRGGEGEVWLVVPGKAASL